MAVVITGANKGIGFQIARKFAESEYKGNIIITSRSIENGNQAIKKLQKEFPNAEFFMHQLDLVNPDSRTALFNYIKEKFGKINILVNNAGFAYKGSSKAPFSEQATNTLAINYFATKDLSIQMSELVTERIVTTSSFTSDFAYKKCSEEVRDWVKNTPDEVAITKMAKEFVELAQNDKHQPKFANTSYGMSKLFIRAFAAAQAKQCPHLKIFSACPGWCKTDMAGDKATKTAYEGADISWWLSTTNDEKVLSSSGSFYGGERELSSWPVTTEEKKSEEKLTLHYFNLKVRAFPAFVGSAYWGEQLHWEKYSFNDWKSNKNNIKSMAAFGQLPVLEDGEFSFSQSNAIVRYLGRKWGKMPSKMKEYALYEALIEESRDIFEIVRSCKRENQWSVLGSKVSTHFTHLEKLMHGNEFMSEIFMSDICLFASINMVLDCWPGGLDNFSQLQGWYGKIASNDAVKLLLANTPRYFTPVPQVKLGSTDQNVSHLGLGCMGMSVAYTSSEPESKLEEMGLSTIAAALNEGVNFFDTAEVYGWGKNEKLLAKAIAKHGREKFVICTKFGFTNPTIMPFNSQPAHVKKTCDTCLENLGIDCIDVYYQHRLDPKTPIEDTVAAMAELVKEGKVRYLGLSEAPADIIRRAHKVHPITCVQTEYSLFTREIEENGVLDTCRELGITLVAYSPVGRGMLTGKIKSLDDLEDDDWRKTNPRFTQDSIDANIKIGNQVEAIAKKKGCTAAQLALAWLLSQGDDIVPIPGTKRVKYLKENNRSINISLSEDEKRNLEKICAGVQGKRYK